MGDCWYKGRFGISGGKSDKIFGDEYKLCANILIQYEDGETKNILTDETWKVKHSQEISNSIYDGEEIDFTYENNTIENVISYNENYTLVPDLSSPIIEKEFLKPVLYISPKGENILDFKQNMVWFIRYKGYLNKSQEILIKHGEVLQNKSFYNANYRTAKRNLKFKGDGKERIYEPLFTYFGFRYALIEGLDKVDPNDFEGIVIYTDLEKTIECETDNKKINQIIKNTLWGQKGNFLDVPTDCPQRDEHLGWTADIQVFTNTACYNMDTYNFYRKYIKDLRGDQTMYYDGDIPMFSPSLKGHPKNGGAVWADAGTIVPWNLYMNCGDKVLLNNSYQMMKDYVDSLIKKDIEQGEKNLILKGFCFGDWLALDGITETSTRGGTDVGYIMSVYYYVSVDLLCKVAKELEKTDDYNKYNSSKKKIYAAILKEFFSQNGRLTINTKTGYILSLHYNIYINKDIIIKGLLEKLRMDAYKLKTGFTGTPLILLTLFDNNLYSNAYHFLYNEKFTGWIYTINFGATTIWKRWNSLLPNGTISGIAMNSFNHYAYGSVCEAINSRIVGIKNLKPGWKKVLIQPHLNYRLKKINFSYDSISGTYKVSWKYDENKFYMNVSIPNGAVVLIILPNKTEYNLFYGEYHFESDMVQKMIAPFSLDTPLFELIENKEATKILKEIIPDTYNSSTGEQIDLQYSSIRLISENPFSGLTPEILDKLQEELSKIKILNYTSPDIAPTDYPTDEPIDSSKDEDKSNNYFLLMFNQLILSLLILLFI